MSVSERKFGTLPTGEEVKIYHLENKKGAYAEVLQYGAILVKMCVPDKKGDLKDVVLGYDDIRGYEINGCFFGAIIGRSGNRIENSRFFIDDKEVVLAENENHNNLHSGPDGFEKKLWEVKEISQEKNSVDFFRLSPDGENGFPGEFSIVVKYEFTEENELKIFYRGRSDAATVANMTNHSYFNLNGEGSGDILNHKITLAADFYTPTDAASVPTGEITSVTGTVMDFRDGRYLGTDIEDSTLQTARGYDHNWVIGTGYGAPHKVLTATGDQSGISMDLSTDYPGIQLYTANYLEHVAGKQGHVYEARDAVCFEPQYFPDAIHHPNFPSPVVKAGETYKKQIIYHFYTD